MRPLILPPLVLIFAVIPLAVTAHCSKKHMSLRSDTLSVCTRNTQKSLHITHYRSHAGTKEYGDSENLGVSSGLYTTTGV